MSAQDFLVELGTEELPPKALNTLADAFLAGIDKGLQAAGLSYETKTVYAAPRRLAVLITALATQQPDRSINLDGPPRQAAFDAEGVHGGCLQCRCKAILDVSRRRRHRQPQLRPPAPTTGAANRPKACACRLNGLMS